MSPSRFSPSNRGISVLEALITVVAVGIIAAGAYQAFSGTSEGSKLTKLESDVTTVNRAVKMYVASGGSLEGVTDPQTILNKLKTTRAGNAKEFAGLRGSMIDKRLAVELVEADEGGPRAVWQAEELRFKIAKSGNGVGRFFLDDQLATVDFGTEERDGSALDLDTNERAWIWAYEDSDSAPRPGPTVIPVSDGGSSGSSTAGSDTAGDGGDDGSPPGPGQLQPPNISPGGGEFDYGDFPLRVLISNPNPPVSSWIMVSIGGGPFSQYRGPIDVEPDTEIRAYVTGNPADWNRSLTTIETYTRESFPLDPPTITPSPTQFENGVDEILVTLTDPNPDGLSKIEFRVLNDTDGSTALSGEYSDPFSLRRSDFPDGATVYATAIGLEPFVVDSEEVNRPIPNAYVPEQLLTPQIALSSPVFSDSISQITITITNPNPAGSSQLRYAIRTPAGAYPAWDSHSVYGGPFTADVSNFPEGFYVQAYSDSLNESEYLDSDPAEAISTTEFFDVPIIGDVLFVVDASSSMNSDFGGVSRYEAAISELTSAIDRIPSNLKFNVAMFDADMHWVDGTWQLHEATEPNQQNMITQVQAVPNDSGTDYQVGLAYPIAFTPRPTQVIFLSDGRSDNDYSAELQDLVDNGIRVDTIGIGDLDDFDSLQEIATATGGTFNYVEEP